MCLGPTDDTPTVSLSAGVQCPRGYGEDPESNLGRTSACLVAVVLMWELAGRGLLRVREGVMETCFRLVRNY